MPIFQILFLILTVVLTGCGGTVSTGDLIASVEASSDSPNFEWLLGGTRMRGAYEFPIGIYIRGAPSGPRTLVVRSTYRGRAWDFEAAERERTSSSVSTHVSIPRGATETIGRLRLIDEGRVAGRIKSRDVSDDKLRVCSDQPCYVMAAGAGSTTIVSDNGFFLGGVAAGLQRILVVRYAGKGVDGTPIEAMTAYADIDVPAGGLNAKADVYVENQCGAGGVHGVVLGEQGPVAHHRVQILRAFTDEPVWDENTNDHGEFDAELAPGAYVARAPVVGHEGIWVAAPKLNVCGRHIREVNLDVRGVENPDPRFAFDACDHDRDGVCDAQDAIPGGDGIVPVTTRAAVQDSPPPDDARCNRDADCGSHFPKCVMGACVECVVSADCPPGKSCRTGGSCVPGCTSDMDCRYGLRCDPSTRACGEPCPHGEMPSQRFCFGREECDSGQCKLTCDESSRCPVGQMCDLTRHLCERRGGLMSSGLLVTGAGKLLPSLEGSAALSVKDYIDGQKGGSRISVETPRYNIGVDAGAP